MDKEIIIDGVNVVECNFLLEREGKQKCESSHATGFGVICDCDKWHNCYYKQLKRLEQENAELKAENFELKESLKCFQTPEVTKALTFYKTGEFDLQEKNCFELQNKIDELETELRVAKMNRLTMFEKLDIVDENTRLKLENEQLKEELETRDNLIEHFRKEAINWAKIANDCIKDIEKYKQTLQEIKKYIAKICKEECGYVQKKRCPDCDCRYGAILDLITKAEEE